ncbi:MAG: methionine adenosyltransferase [bacterium JZ-2024 1]
MRRRQFTSESVTEGHPDKLCDRIADAILDEILKEDPYARVAVEVMAVTGTIFLAGQVTTTSHPQFSQIARDAISSVGYTSPEDGFDADNAGILVSIDRQSPEIAQAVNLALEYRSGERKENHPLKMTGAGDQGIMIGFACRETEELMPLPIMLAHRLVKRLAYVRKNKILDFLRPDGKSQVTVEYDGNTPIAVRNILVSAQHKPGVKRTTLEEGILEEVVKKVIPEQYWTRETETLFNPSGSFEKGGPSADTGLSGRKAIVDTYGGYCRHGGGSFSGKDPTKVDRSATYYARYIAKNLVAAGLCERCEVMISYAIGKAYPTSLDVETFGTEQVAPERILSLVREYFDPRPGSILLELDLCRPIYLPLSSYGHFGREDLDLTWEKTDRAEALRSAVSA